MCKAESAQGCCNEAHHRSTHSFSFTKGSKGEAGNQGGRASKGARETLTVCLCNVLPRLVTTQHVVHLLTLQLGLLCDLRRSVRQEVASAQLPVGEGPRLEECNHKGWAAVGMKPCPQFAPMLAMLNASLPWKSAVTHHSVAGQMQSRRCTFLSIL